MYDDLLRRQPRLFQGYWYDIVCYRIGRLHLVLLN